MRKYLGLFAACFLASQTSFASAVEKAAKKADYIVENAMNKDFLKTNIANNLTLSMAARKDLQELTGKDKNKTHRIVQDRINKGFPEMQKKYKEKLLQLLTEEELNLVYQNFRNHAYRKCYKEVMHSFAGSFNKMMLPVMLGSIPEIQATYTPTQRQFSEVWLSKDQNMIGAVKKAKELNTNLDGDKLQAYISHIIMQDLHKRLHESEMAEGLSIMQQDVMRRFMEVSMH